MQNIPKHVAIIPDGNRRWAKSKGLKEIAGHEKSAEKSNIIALLEEAHKLKVEYVSIWGFSTENWKRSKLEVNFLFSLMRKVIKELKEYILEKNVKFTHVGRKDRLPSELSADILKLEEESKNNSGLKLQILLDYGGRDEIIRAVNKIIKSKKQNLDEESFKEYLDTKTLPDPDLIIRTSGEMRTSGIMPYQSVYSELYFTEKHFPDFKPEDLRKAIEEFSLRQRRFGGNSK